MVYEPVFTSMELHQRRILPVPYLTRDLINIPVVAFAIPDLKRLVCSTREFLATSRHTPSYSTIDV
jgi:hypothetical protein